MLLLGFCAPLKGYLGRADCAAVLAGQQLVNGCPWSLPVLLEVDAAFAASVNRSDKVALRDPEGVLLAVLTVEESWSASDLPVPAAAELAGLGYDGGVFLAGPVVGVEAPPHYDFSDLRLSPEELHAQFAKRGWRKVLACQPADMIHRADAARIVHAARIAQANVLVPVSYTHLDVYKRQHQGRYRRARYRLRRRYQDLHVHYARSYRIGLRSLAGEPGAIPRL